MRKTTKWAKVFSILLSLSLFMIYASSDQGQGKGQGKGKKGGDKGFISVCVKFSDTPGDRIMSDGMDGMSPFCDSTDGVLAIVGVKNGGFRLDTNGKGRTVYLDFEVLVSTCEYYDPPFPTGLHDIDLRIGEEFKDGAWTGTKLDIVEMAGGEENKRYGALTIDFAPKGMDSAPKKGRPSKLLYRIVFGTFAPGMHCGGPVTVVRADDDENGPVNSWTLSATAGDVACLYKIDNNFKEINVVGCFSLPFSIDVVEQQ